MSAADVKAHMTFCQPEAIWWLADHTRSQD